MTVNVLYVITQYDNTTVSLNKTWRSVIVFDIIVGTYVVMSEVLVRYLTIISLLFRRTIQTVIPTIIVYIRNQRG